MTYDERFDLCLDYVYTQIHNSWRHEPHSVYIDEAVRKYAKGAKDAKQIEKDLRFFIAN